MQDKAHNWSGELATGFCYFFALLYLLPLNSSLLMRAGVPFAGAYTATVLLLAASAFLLGRAGFSPLVAGPAIACNTYLSYILVVSQGMSWPDAMGIVFTASILLWLLLRMGFYDYFWQAVPKSLTASMTAGVGAILVMLGLEQGHLIVPSAITVTTSGDLQDPIAFLTIWGILVTAGLWIAGSRYALAGGFLAALAGAIGLNLPDWPEFFFAIPDYPQQLGQISFCGLWEKPGIITLVLVFILVESMLVRVSFRAVDKDNNPAETVKKTEALAKPLKLTALLGAVSALLGAGAVALEPVSLLGNKDSSGRASALMTVLFAVMLFCAPLVQSLAECQYLVAPALVVAGFQYLRKIAEMDWDEPVSGLSGMLLLFFSALGNPLVGVAFGFVSYCVLNLLRGTGREVHPIIYGMALVFLVQLISFSL